MIKKNAPTFLEEFMINRFIGLTCLFLFFESQIHSDEINEPKNLPDPVIRGTPFDAGPQPDMRLWVDADYLLWWTENAPLPVPIVTTGSLSDPVPAAIGQSGTKVLFGNESIHNGALSGFRIALRSWLGDEQDYAIEGSGFYLPKQTIRAFSDESSELLGIPFNNVAPNPLPADSGGSNGLFPGETAILLGFSPLTYIGSINATSSTRLWDAELNGLFHFLSKPTFRLSALGGLTYTDLFDELNLHYYNNSGSDPVFRAANMNDQFQAHNEIFAGQMGLRGDWSSNWLFASFVAKLGLGGNLQIARINGDFSDPVPNLYNHYGIGESGGIFAQPTNSGKHTQGKFIYIPAATIKFGFNLEKHLRVTFGYDILYLSNVVRPGDLIDRTINETQAGPSSGGYEAILTGPARPKVRMQTTSYWAQGLNVGLEVRF